MTTTPEYAQLSLYVYKSQDLKNRIDLPSGWELAEPLHPDNLGGFSYGVFRRTGTTEIVLAYTGSNEALIADYLGTNFPAGVGLPSIQVSNAALAYERALQIYGTDIAGSNITFSGHSLGGGLASVIATWFNRPAVVFDEAPFQLTAANPVLLAATRVFLLSKGYTNTAMDNAISDFTLREQQVQNHYLKGEILADLRADFNTVAGSSTPISANVVDISTSSGDKVTLHSQALLTAMLLSDSFRQATFISSRVIPLLMDSSLYAYDTATRDQQNVLINFIRSEQGTGDKLTHFAIDLNKLGTNVTGLDKAAQDAIIAQGIEWYYWQGTDYAGQEFFSKTGDLLQYGNAIDTGAGGVKDKAGRFVDKWLTPLYNDAGAFGGNHTFDQWSVAVGSAGVTATAREAGKSQIFVGGTGGDTFTGGNLADVLLAGAGNDYLDGGVGSDKLYGGAGQDTYTFTGNWGSDLVLDADGQGSIVIDGVTLQGGKKIAGLDNVWQNKDQGYSFALAGSGAGKVLVITKDGSLNTIRVQGWQNSQLGLSMDDTPAEAPPISHTYYGDQRAPLNASGSYDWGATSWLADGTLSGGVAEAGFADVITGTAGNDKIAGLGGNDALDGGAGNDEIDGGAGDDLIGGGAGSDNIKGGNGNDTILGATTLTAAQRIKLTDHFTVPAGATVGTSGPTWANFRPVNAPDFIGYTIGGGGSLSMDDAPDVIDAGDGDDEVIGGRGNDTIIGGAGNDYIFGYEGNDIIEGGNGNDALIGDGTWPSGFYTTTDPSRHGADFIDGGNGNDLIDGGGGSDQLFGGAGNDLIRGDTTGPSPNSLWVPASTTAMTISTVKKAMTFCWAKAGLTPSTAGLAMTSCGVTLCRTRWLVNFTVMIIWTVKTAMTS